MKTGVPSKSQDGGVISLLLLWMTGIAVLFYLCVMRDLPDIQHRLHGKVLSAVVGSGAANASVALDGRDVTLSGKVTSEELIAAAGDAAYSVLGVRKVNNNIALDTANLNIAAAFKPAELDLQIDADKIVLHGVIPTEESNALLAEGVQQAFPAHVVENNILVDTETADPVWLESTLTALAAIQRIDSPELEIMEDSVTVRGKVTSDEERDALLEELKQAYTDDLEITDQLEVEPPPNLLPPALAMKLANDELTLIGKLRSSDDLESIAGVTMSTFDLQLVNNEVGVDPEVQEALWLQPLVELIPLLRDFRSLEINIEEEQAVIQGETISSADQTAALEMINETLGQLIAVESTITIGDPVDSDSTAPEADENAKAAESDNASENSEVLTDTVDETAEAELIDEDNEEIASDNTESASNDLSVAADTTDEGDDPAQNLTTGNSELGESDREILPEPDSGTDAETAEITQTETEAAPEDVIQTEADSVAESEDDTIQDETDIDAEANDLAQAVAGVETESEDTAQAEIDTDTESEDTTQAEIDTDTESEDTAQTEADTDTESEDTAQTEADTDVESEDTAQTEADTDDTESEDTGRAEVDTDAAAEEDTAQAEADSDADVDDEIQAENTGTEPAESEQTALSDQESLRQEIQKLDISAIRFKSSSAILTPESRRILRSMADLLLRYNAVPIRILGYTDSSGNKQSNLALSQARAESVRQFLFSLGVEEERLSAEGFGDANPIADNSTAEGRALNRRIEFTY